jgi:imidazolonepropionase-like amidohydrolase
MFPLPSSCVTPSWRRCGGPLLLGAALAGLATPVAAQDLLAKAPPQSAPIVLKNCKLFTVSGGIVLDGTLWFADGQIRGVLAADQTLQLPPGPEPVVLDLQGKLVFPGMISASTSLGLIEIGSVRQTVDTDEVGDLSPEALAIVAVNPDSTAIPVARSNGVLAAAVFPSGGLLPGRASVLQLDGWTNADLTVRADAGPVVAWPAERGDRGGRRGAGRRPAGGDPDGDAEQATQQARQRIDDTFAAARAWLDAFSVDSSIGVDLRHAALAAALRGETKVFVLADELEQIESAVLWATSRQLLPVIVGGRDAAQCATLLRERKVPVIVNGVHRLPRRDDSPYDEAFTLPHRLLQAEVKFCIATGSDFSNDRNLPYHAAAAAAHGLTQDQAFAAITLHAAEILGVGDRLGSLAVGKDATLFVADGHPFELGSRIELAFVQGRQVDLRNKQTELAKKYRERYRQLRGK